MKDFYWIKFENGFCRRCKTPPLETDRVCFAHLPISGMRPIVFHDGGRYILSEDWIWDKEKVSGELDGVFNQYDSSNAGLFLITRPFKSIPNLYPEKFKGSSECNHEVSHYIGLREEYDYCLKCQVKL